VERKGGCHTVECEAVDHFRGCDGVVLSDGSPTGNMRPEYPPLQKRKDGAPTIVAASSDQRVGRPATQNR